jgi:hypothetical protein
MQRFPHGRRDDDINGSDCMQGAYWLHVLSIPHAPLFILIWFLMYRFSRDGVVAFYCVR